MREQLTCALGLYIMANRAILPTEANTPSRFSISIEPVTVFDYRNRSEFIAAIEKAIAAGNPTVPNPSEDELERDAGGFPAFKNPVGLKYAEVSTWDELERKSIYASLRCYPSTYLVEVSGRDKNGKWSDDLALELRLPANVGVPVVVDAILDHLKTRRDLPGLVLGPFQQEQAKGA